MAEHLPPTVMEVILAIPETENVRVHEDFIDAALAMPPPLAAKLVKRLTRWVLSPYCLLSPEKAGRLMSHLAQGGEIDAALKLARSILAVIQDTRREAVRAGLESGFRLPPAPVARFETWTYGEIVRVHIPFLVEAAGDRAFHLLCDVLAAAVSLSRDQGEAYKPVDNSFIWRMSIDDVAESESDDVLNILVSAVRDAARTLVRTNVDNLPRVVTRLEERGWFIFVRISLDLLCQFPEAAPDVVGSRLTDRTLFDEVGVRHEYAALVAKAFTYLSPEQQQNILGWIDHGPELQTVRRRTKPMGESLSDEEMTEYVLVWQRDRLSWIGESLPQAWAQRLKELVGAFGPPQHANFPYWHGELSGGRTPGECPYLR